VISRDVFIKLVGAWNGAMNKTEYTATPSQQQQRNWGFEFV
jgi:hypothetical protein